ncbi:hypothetical protein D3C78_1120400 [compost metagenome]
MLSNELRFYLNDFAKNEQGTSIELIETIQRQLDFTLPGEYVSLMEEFNGGEGEVGENGWLCLFPIEDLIEINNDYGILMEHIPEYFLFGKDAADTGYVFHKQKHTIHSLGLMSNFDTDPIEFCGTTILEFLEYLA